MKYAVRAAVGMVILGWVLQGIGCAASSASAPRGRANSAAGIGTTAVNFGDEYSSAGSVDAPAATQPTATLPALLYDATPISNAPDSDQKAAGQMAINAASQIGIAINQSMSVIMAVLIVIQEWLKTRLVAILSTQSGATIKEIVSSYGGIIAGMTAALHKSVPRDDNEVQS